MKNPFEFGRELGAAELVDREEEVATTVSMMTEGGKLFLIGPRRYGKTSILKAASDVAEQKHRAVVLRYNAEGFPTIDLLVGRLVTDAARALQGGLERAAAKVKDYFSRLRPEFSVNATQTEWTVKVGAGLLTGDTDQVPLLLDALDGLEKLAKEEAGERPVALVLDEFQAVVEKGGTVTEGQIRAAVQQHRHVGYVFAGSDTRLLTAMVMDHSRPFYRLGLHLFVGPVPREAFRRFLSERFAQGGFSITGRDPRSGEPQPESPLDLILDLAEEVPYNVQALAHTCWNLLAGAQEPSGRVLSPDLVRAALEKVVRQNSPFYTQQWVQLTAIQKKTLVAVVEEGGRRLQSQEVTRRVGTTPASVRKALLKLMDSNILREEAASGETRYRFEDPFFARWITLFTAKI
jgi:energy-coupling factor transporter ATP-binding protein EcfA2